MAPAKKTEAEAPEENTVVEGSSLPDYVAENYRALVADENRNLSFEDVAKRAESEGDAELAAWARAEAAGKGKDVTPKDATPTRNQVKRAADKAAKAAAGEDHPKTEAEVGQVDAAETPGTTPPTGVEEQK